MNKYSNLYYLYVYMLKENGRAQMISDLDDIPNRYTIRVDLPNANGRKGWSFIVLTPAGEEDELVYETDI